MSGRGAPRPPGRIGPLLGRPIGQFLTFVYWHTIVRGGKRIPRKGPVVIIANHVGFIDGPVAVGAIPRASHFMVKKDMFRGPLALILRGTGQIQVEGDGRRALGRARAVLQRGGIIGVFPEGTRGAGDAASLAGGAAWLALHGGAPVVPLALLGTRLAGESVNVWPRPRRRMILEFGEPITLEIPEGVKGTARQQFAENAVAEALRTHVQRVVSENDIPLPMDDHLRKSAQS